MPSDFRYQNLARFSATLDELQAYAIKLVGEAPVAETQHVTALFLQGQQQLAGLDSTLWQLLEGRPFPPAVATQADALLTGINSILASAPVPSKGVIPTASVETIALNRSFSASAGRIQQAISGLTASAGRPLSREQAGYLADVAEFTPLIGLVIDIFEIPDRAIG